MRTGLCRVVADLGSVRLKPKKGVYEYSHEFAEKIMPVVEEALAGARRIQAQKQFVEAWLALCRFLGEGTVFDRLERLTKWMSANQLPSND